MPDRQDTTEIWRTSRSCSADFTHTKNIGKKTKTPSRVSTRSTNACGYLRFNTFGRVLAVKFRLSEAALTFAIVKQHFCWLTVPPCYSCSANQCRVFIWLVAILSSPHTHATPHHGGSTSAMSSVTTGGLVSSPTAIYLSRWPGHLQFDWSASDLATFYLTSSYFDAPLCHVSVNNISKMCCTFMRGSSNSPTPGSHRKQVHFYLYI